MSELAGIALLIVGASLGWVAGRQRPLALIFRCSRRWSRGRLLTPCASAEPELVKNALNDLFVDERLSNSPLQHLSTLERSVAPALNLRTLLVDAVRTVASSGRPRDAEAGRVLMDYYVKRVGSHEVVMERLCLSRPTFYRRLRRGLLLVAQQLEESSQTSPQARHALALARVAETAEISGASWARTVA